MSVNGILTEEEKTKILFRRGFTKEEIESGFECLVGHGTWEIKNVSKEEIIKTNKRSVLDKLFEKDSVHAKFADPWPVGNDFSIFDQAEEFEYPSAGELEPYIACLIGPLNRCGVHTCMCCDGWHSTYDSRYFRPVKIYMPERYSVLWMWMITEFVFREQWNKGKKKFEGWEPFNADDDTVRYSKNMMVYNIARLVNLESREKLKIEMDVYDKIYRYSLFLTEHREEFLKIRDKWINNFRKTGYSKIVKMGFMEVRRTALQFIRDDLTDLSKKYVSPDL